MVKAPENQRRPPPIANFKGFLRRKKPQKPRKKSRSTVVQKRSGTVYNYSARDLGYIFYARVPAKKIYRRAKMTDYVSGS